jgi:hypothetical protein
MQCVPLLRLLAMPFFIAAIQIMYVGFVPHGLRVPNVHRYTGTLPCREREREREREKEKERAMVPCDDAPVGRKKRRSCCRSCNGFSRCRRNHSILRRLDPMVANRGLTHIIILTIFDHYFDWQYCSPELPTAVEAIRFIPAKGNSTTTICRIVFLCSIFGDEPGLSLGMNEGMNSTSSPMTMDEEDDSKANFQNGRRGRQTETHTFHRR